MGGGQPFGSGKSDLMFSPVTSEDKTKDKHFVIIFLQQPREKQQIDRKGGKMEKQNLCGQSAADDVHNRANCWKSAYKATNAKMKDTPLVHCLRQVD